VELWWQRLRIQLLRSRLVEVLLALSKLLIEVVIDRHVGLAGRGRLRVVDPEDHTQLGALRELSIGRRHDSHWTEDVRIRLLIRRRRGHLLDGPRQDDAASRQIRDSEIRNGDLMTQQADLAGSGSRRRRRILIVAVAIVLLIRGGRGGALLLDRDVGHVLSRPELNRARQLAAFGNVYKAAVVPRE